MIRTLKSHRSVIKQNPLTNSIQKLFSATPEEQYQRFQSQYKLNMDQYQKKMADLEHNMREENKKELEKRTAQLSYSHPYNDEHHPLNFSQVTEMQFNAEFLGPEQVSPHYENFLVSRKYATAFLGTMGILSFGIGTYDLHWVLKSTFLPIVTWTGVMYLTMEGRKSWFKPLLVRFYRRVAMNEMYNIQSFYSDNIQYQVNQLLGEAKQQLDYWECHKSYQDVKSESINTFLINEYKNLQQNVHQRALNVLVQAKTYEDMNQNKYINNIIDQAVEAIDKELAGPNKQKIQDQILQTAIESLAKGYCDYANDPIMPLVRAKISEKVQEVQKMSEQEQSDLTCLKEEQMQAIRDMDQRAKEEFLTRQPNIDNQLKNNENVKKILSQWGH